MGMQPLCMLLVLMTFTSCSIAMTTVPSMNESTVVTVMETMILLSTFAPELPAPENVTAVAINTTSFMVTWDILSEDDSISYDMVVSSTSNASDEEALLNVTSGIIIDEKTPGDRYEVVVFSLLDGQRTPSTETKIRLFPESVKSLSVQDYHSENVTLMWEIKDNCANKGCVWSGYNVSYVRAIGIESEEYMSGEDDTSIDIMNLIPGSLYNFFIYVVSDDEQSSEETASQRLIPESVKSLSVEDYNSENVTLMWEIKDNCANKGCVWSGYTVSYVRAEGIESEEYMSGEDDTSIDIMNLIPGSLYNFFIYVVSDDEQSSEETASQRLIPESVKSLSVQDYHSENVSLIWEIKDNCANENCVWSGYTVKYTRAEGLESGEYMSGKNDTSIDITSLIPGSLYNFFIYVVSDDQRSSQETALQRLIPESVKTLSVEDYHSENVTLIWEIKDKCANERCVWSGYTVKYNSSEGNDSGECMSDKNDTSIDILDLIPGSLYDFIIYVVSDNEQSSEEPASQRLRPASVTSANSTIRQNSITVEWNPPGGFVTSYQTNITDNNEYSHPKEVNTTWVEFDRLIAFSDYTVTICSKSYEEECENIYELNIQTLPDVSSAPQDLVLTSESITTVTVAFETPELPNGDIFLYKISYNGKRGELEDDNLITVTVEDDGVYSVLIPDLLPGFQYEFTVVAVNQEGDGEPATDTITLGQEEPETPSSTESPVANTPGTALKSFTVEFSSTVFSHCNGEINNYTVIVVESGAYDSETDEPISAKGSPPPTKTFNEVSSKKPLGEYQAFAPKPYPYPWSIEDCQAGSSRRRRQTTMLEVIVIGDGSSSEGYTNGELHSNRAYRVKFRVMNEVGYADSIYSDEIETDLHPAAWLVPLLFGLFLILLILIILIILKERREPGSIRRKMRWSNGGIENPAFVEDKPMRRTGDKRPVKLANFGNHLEEMEKDSDYLFSEEYNDLRPVGKNQADDTAKLDCNKSKNRFSNILPYDHTRVKLSPAEDEPGSDYINANYMVGAKSSREYIACQGPLQNTEEDMWRMVWEQSASLIVMVTQLMEGNKIKCHQYWCQEGEGPVRYGDIIVKNIATEQNDLWVVRKFSLTRGPITREVLHFNFTAWPDHGVPESPDYLIKFVQAVRRVKKTDGKPIVVHCSAGVGRTGTFIALDTLMSQMESSDEVDIFGLIRSMRMNRCLMVQTEIQYVYIHQCIMALLEGDDENAYENYNGTTDPYYNEALI